MDKPLIITTANTAFSEAIHPANAHLIGDTDVLLAQEVLRVDRNILESTLGKIGLQIAEYHDESGLLIAFNNERLTLEFSQHHEIQRASILNSTLQFAGLKPRFRSRGLLTAHLRTDEGTPFVVATAHPIVCVRALSRAKQVRRMGQILQEEDGLTPLIFGADMNHYPSARALDTDFMANLGLVQLQNDEPTFMLEGTKHAWLKKLGLPDGILDMLAGRGLEVTDTERVKIASDHYALRAKILI